LAGADAPILSVRSREGGLHGPWPSEFLARTRKQYARPGSSPTRWRIARSGGSPPGGAVVQFPSHVAEEHGVLHLLVTTPAPLIGDDDDTAVHTCTENVDGSSKALHGGGGVHSSSRKSGAVTGDQMGDGDIGRDGDSVPVTSASVKLPTPAVETARTRKAMTSSGASVSNTQKAAPSRHDGSVIIHPERLVCTSYRKIELPYDSAGRQLRVTAVVVALAARRVGALGGWPVGQPPGFTGSRPGSTTSSATAARAIAIKAAEQNPSKKQHRLPSLFFGLRGFASTSASPRSGKASVMGRTDALSPGTMVRGVHCVWFTIFSYVNVMTSLVLGM
jgi:hypothetical protein